MPSPCDSCHACCGGSGFSRRSLLRGASLAPSVLAAAAPAPERIQPLRRRLSVQPVLVYQIFKRRPQTSWRPWGGLFTEAEVAQEKERIGKEMAGLGKSADLDIRPLKTAASLEESKTAGLGDHDVLLLYASTGPGAWLENVTSTNKWTVFFVRHRSGPVSEWYEIVSPRFLRKTVDEYGEPNITDDDVVVDDMADVAWRLRALHGLKNAMNRKVVCIGGASGWGRGGREAPQRARDIWKLDLIEYTYPDLKARLVEARADSARSARAAKLAKAFLAEPGVKLETNATFVENAYLLADVMRGIMAEKGADAITVNNCMGTIMGVSETTACLPLSILNDEGALAFCESDFVVIPSGILLEAISHTPMFLNDPTYPHHGLITLAHCTAPRMMDGKTKEPVRVLTHFESDYGASPKVEMHKGQVLTNLIPDFNGRRWVGFKGETLGAPFHPICRSQIDVGIQCSDRKLAGEMKGFHWMTGYGDWRKELGYALQKIGVQWLDLTV